MLRNVVGFSLDYISVRLNCGHEISNKSENKIKINQLIDCPICTDIERSKIKQDNSISQIFDKCNLITMSKRHDYTSTSDNHENFKRSALLADWFPNSADKSYVILIGTKLARLASLLDAKIPNHESIEDSFIDLINYCGLWAERRLQK